MSKKIIPFVLFFLLSLLLAGPALVTKEQKETKQARQFIIALDISYSMNADDLKPNRLEVAKQTIKNLLNHFQGDQIGLVLFAGKPFASIPLTFDLQAIQDMITQYSTETIDQQNLSLQGTAIGDAILTSITLLKKQSSSSLSKEVPKAEDSKSIILITDGTANVGVDPLLASKYATQSGISLYTIGIGSKQGGSIPLETAFGIRRQQVEGVDVKTLSEIAKISGGSFARVTNEQEFENALRDIAAIKPGNIEQTTIKHYSPLGNIFLVLSLILIIILCIQQYKNVIQLTPSKS